MTNPPTVSIDVNAFWHDPYPTLAHMREHTPICTVPELAATLMLRRDDIFNCEKMVDVFSSHQPGGLMNEVMGLTLMRRDGESHLEQRKQIFPSLSPRTVLNTWKQAFIKSTETVLAELESEDEIDLVTQFAMPVSGHALCAMTGLTNITPNQMDAASQGMIDAIANYTGDPDIKQKGAEQSRIIDQAIDDMIPVVTKSPNSSMLSVALEAGQDIDSIKANIKVTIGGGQNEPRDAIAGTAWAVLTHNDQHELIRSGDASWIKAFEEYARWVSPISMIPRRIAAPYQIHGVDLEPESRLFFMIGAANRDERIFEQPDIFDITRDTSKSIAFGAGPHFCAGAAASRCLIAEVALPLLFDRCPNLQLTGDVPFGGWAFRGPLSMPVRLN